MPGSFIFRASLSANSFRPGIMKNQRNAIAIAGIRGGSGKTLVSIGIIRALRLSGHVVAPFKKGPDYIDPAWLGLAAERQCFNLDTFLMTQNNLIETYLGRNSDANIAVIEGNRGIFDGFDAEGTHSFAELIKITGAAVVLVVDCTKCSRTTAALVRGCMDFDRDIAISGVILNQIAGERHRKIVAESIEKYCGIPVLGAVPRINTPSFTERHLGLVPVHEQKDPAIVVEEIAQTALENIDLLKLVEISQNGDPGMRTNGSTEPSIVSAKNIKLNVKKFQKQSGKNRREIDTGPVIGIFRDAAFNFYYPENLELLESNGARLVYINSMEDKLPEIDGLYIGGGFPETHAAKLSANTALRSRVKELSEAGGPVYAECGGLIYL
ncbi:MAG TPA: cobyrinate a,c-diamide synthase, partial [Spirochaetes bacterium]|nr:cobyrinate a,c-diamide synthase [Spirochaetota bacterium]